MFCLLDFKFVRLYLDSYNFDNGCCNVMQMIFNKIKLMNMGDFVLYGLKLKRRMDLAAMVESKRIGASLVNYRFNQATEK